ncbi:MAG: hypothetical protein M1812_006601 [Candelaria pacifica]|nr:MAG: hypothetical protein M1812_006601 [Candelaria pacifica]
MDATKSSSSTLDEDSPINHSNSPELDLTSLPPIYVLASHLTTDELHAIEDSLTDRGAQVSYDLNEVNLVIGKVGTKKRAELDLRCRRLWTEDVTPEFYDTKSLRTTQKRSKEPLRKKRRIEKVASETKTIQDTVNIDDVSTESEPDNGSRCIQKREPHSTSSTESEQTSASLEPAVTFNDTVSGNIVRVIKLDWLDESISAGKSLSLQPYTVYEGQRKPRPENAVTPTRTTKTTAIQAVQTVPKSEPGSSSLKSGAFRGILERAKGEAASTNQKSGASRYVSAAKAQKALGNPSSMSSSQGSSQTMTRPTQLLHQTTSEHDEGVSGSLPEMPVWVTEGKKYACERVTLKQSPNERFIDLLKKIRLARLLTADEIGVRAYSTSIAALAAYPRALTSTREVTALPGCETKIANLYREWRENDGRVQAVEAIENDEVLIVLRLFWEIWGVGATTAREFYFDRGWRDLDDIVEHGWHTLQRVQQIGVKYYEEFLERIPRSEVESIAAKILEHARRITDDGIEHCIVGGYRRGNKDCGDVDVIISHRDETMTLGLIKDIVASLETEGWITHTLTLNLTTSKRDQKTLPFRNDGGGHGFDSLDKALVVWQDINWPNKEADLAANEKAKNPNIHRRVDIIISPWRTVGCAIVGWSGGNTFERDLRRYAKHKHGWKFDSSGVRDRATGEVLDLEGSGGPSTTWQEAEKKVFQGLGLEYREPWERCTG